MPSQFKKDFGGTEDAQQCYYLPMRSAGVPVLIPVGERLWRADNSILGATNPGIAFRSQKDLSAKIPNEVLLWDSEIDGIEDGDDWVKCLPRSPAVSSVQRETAFRSGESALENSRLPIAASLSPSHGLFPREVQNGEDRDVSSPTIPAIRSFRTDSSYATPELGGLLDNVFSEPPAAPLPRNLETRLDDLESVVRNYGRKEQAQERESGDSMRLERRLVDVEAAIGGLDKQMRGLTELLRLQQRGGDPLATRTREATAFSTARVIPFYSDEPNSEFREFSNFYRLARPYEYILPSYARRHGFPDAMWCSFSEKAIVAVKAALMGDLEAWYEIDKVDNPMSVKALGRGIKNFDDRLWNEHLEDVAFDVVRQKFEADANCRQVLLSTGDAIIAYYGAPNDGIWGIGLPANDGRAYHPDQWLGRNVLGYALMKVREHIRANPASPAMEDAQPSAIASKGNLASFGHLPPPVPAWPHAQVLSSACLGSSICIESSEEPRSPPSTDRSPPSTGKQGEDIETSIEADRTMLLAAEVEDLRRRLAEADGIAASSAVRVEEAQRMLREQAIAAEEAAAALRASHEAERQALGLQVEELRRESAAAKKQARHEACKEKEATLDDVRAEMEKELESMLKQKDDQIRALEAKVANQDKAHREQDRELEQATDEVEALRKQVAGLRRELEMTASQHKKELGTMAAEHKQHVEELEQRGGLEERQKHELALNLRSVEERARGEIAQIEAQKAQLELQQTALQAQLQAEQQKCVDLAMSLGEAQQSLAVETSRGHEGDEEARLAAETEARDLQDRLTVAEHKLLDAQSVRDMFAKETEMYRAELKVAREERLHLEEDLAKAQERARELREATSEPNASQQHAIESMQKDFESRVERYRDEVTYLRKKCDEKEHRCEQLLAEKSSLVVELRSAGGGTGVWRGAGADLGPSGGLADLEAGGAGKAAASSSKVPGASRGGIRSLPLAAPAWLRSADEPLRMAVRTLTAYPQARLIFFAYVILLHAWVLFILQQSAVQ